MPTIALTNETVRHICEMTQTTCVHDGIDALITMAGTAKSLSAQYKTVKVVSPETVEAMQKVLGRAD